MSSTLTSTQSEFSVGRWAAKPLVDATVRPADLKNEGFPSKRPSLAKRASRAVVRFLIAFCVGVAATLAWQSYGDAAREMIASSSPQGLGWLAPSAAPAMQAVALPPDQEDLKTISFGLAGMRQRVDQIAAQFVAGQEQTTRDITELHAAEKDILENILKLHATEQEILENILKGHAAEQDILANILESGRIEARTGLRMMPTVGIEIERAPL